MLLAAASVLWCLGLACKSEQAPASLTSMCRVRFLEDGKAYDSYNGILISPRHVLTGYSIDIRPTVTFGSNYFDREYKVVDQNYECEFVGQQAWQILKLNRAVDEEGVEPSKVANFLSAISYKNVTTSFRDSDGNLKEMDLVANLGICIEPPPTADQLPIHHECAKLRSTEPNLYSPMTLKEDGQPTVVFGVAQRQSPWSTRETRPTYFNRFSPEEVECFKKQIEKCMKKK